MTVRITDEELLLDQGDHNGNKQIVHESLDNEEDEEQEELDVNRWGNWCGMENLIGLGLFLIRS